MPTYDYACRRCGHAFEHFQSISDKLLKKCPECGKLSLDRLFGTGIGVVFKGSGFYETDYKRAGKDGGKEATSPSADKGGASAKPGSSKTPANDGASDAAPSGTEDKGSAAAAAKAGTKSKSNGKGKRGSSDD